MTGFHVSKDTQTLPPKLSYSSSLKNKLAVDKTHSQLSGLSNPEVDCDLVLVRGKGQDVLALSSLQKERKKERKEGRKKERKKERKKKKRLEAETLIPSYLPILYVK